MAAGWWGNPPIWTAHFPGDPVRRGGLHQFHFHLGDAGLVDVEFFGGGEREIDDASGNERAAIGDADERGGSSLHISDAHDGAQGISAVSSGHGVHVVDFAVRSAAVVVRRPVPASESGFGGDWTRVGGKGRLGEVGFGGGFFAPGVDPLGKLGFPRLGGWLGRRGRFVAGLASLGSVDSAGGGGAGTLTCVGLGWAHALSKRIAIRTKNSARMTAEGARRGTIAIGEG